MQRSQSMQINFLRVVKEYYSTRPFYIFLAEYYIGLIAFFIFIEGLNFLYVALFSIKEYSAFMMYLDIALITIFLISLGVFGVVYILSVLKNITNFYFLLQFLATDSDNEPESVYRSDNLFMVLILSLIIQCIVFLVVNPESFKILEKVYIPYEKLPVYVVEEKTITKIKNTGIDLNSTKYNFAKEQNLSSGYINIIQKKKVQKRGFNNVFEELEIIPKYFEFLSVWTMLMFMVMLIHHHFSSRFIRD